MLISCISKFIDTRMLHSIYMMVLEACRHTFALMNCQKHILHAEVHLRWPIISKTQGCKYYEFLKGCTAWTVKAIFSVGFISDILIKTCQSNPATPFRIYLTFFKYDAFLAFVEYRVNLLLKEQLFMICAVLILEWLSRN